MPSPLAFNPFRVPLTQNVHITRKALYTKSEHINITQFGGHRTFSRFIIRKKGECFSDEQQNSKKIDWLALFVPSICYVYVWAHYLACNRP